MLCLKTENGAVCPHALFGGPRRWECPRGHVWWGNAGGALRSKPWPADLGYEEPTPWPALQLLLLSSVAGLVVIAILLWLL